MVRSALRAKALDRDDQFEFSQIVVDGYSGGELNDGYLTGILLKVGSVDGPGSTKLELHADDGEINQIGTGQVTFSGNVLAKQDVTISGDLVVNGTRTELNVETLVVEDPVAVFNSNGLGTGLTGWTGISGRDDDGYNRLGFIADGGLHDGYWALSVLANADADAVPDRALAYIGAGDAYGDLSSTASGNSGASKIGISTISGMAAGDVQEALEELNSSTESIEGTTNSEFTINTDADATDEDPCLIMKGGDGASLIEGYLCLITDSGSGDRFEFNIYEGTSQNDIDVHIGSSGLTDDIDSVLTFNAGDGGAAKTAEIRLDGSQDRLEYTATAHLFDGYSEFLDSMAVFGRFDAYGNVRLGNSPLDTLDVDATIVSDLLPTDCSYALGRPGNTWEDGYFCFFTPSNYTAVGSNESLEGHLKGIDDALVSGGVALKPPRGIYFITTAEAAAEELDTSRTINLGDQTDVGGFSDSDFLKYIHIYRDGQLLLADASPKADSASITNDFARKTGTLDTIIFAENLRKNSVVTVLDFT